MPMHDSSSAGNTFSMSRCAMTLPIVARRSPAIRTPPLNVAATIVVPCGASTTPCAGSGRRPGSRPGAYAPRKSVNDELVTSVNAAGSRPPPQAASGPAVVTVRPSARIRGRTPRRSPPGPRRSRRGSRRRRRRARPCARRHPQWRNPERSPRPSSAPRPGTSGLTAPAHRCPSSPCCLRRVEPLARPYPSVTAGQCIDECGGVLAAVQQPSDVGLRPAERLEGGHPLQGVPPGDVEDDGVPRCGHDLVRIAPQALASEVGPGVLGWTGDCVLDRGVAEEPLHPSGSDEPVVEPLLRAYVAVLEVHCLQLGCGPVQSVPVTEALEEHLLGHPVKLVRAAPGVVGEPVEHRLPTRQHVQRLSVSVRAEAVLDELAR